mgnify:CR=1 FL=1
MATEPLSAQVWDQIGLAQRETFGDFRNLIIYGQRTADNRFAFGGRGAPYHFGSRIKAKYDSVGKKYGENVVKITRSKMVFYGYKPGKISKKLVKVFELKNVA